MVIIRFIKNKRFNYLCGLYEYECNYFLQVPNAFGHDPCITFPSIVSRVWKTLVVDMACCKCHIVVADVAIHRLIVWYFVLYFRTKQLIVLASSVWNNTKKENGTDLVVWYLMKQGIYSMGLDINLFNYILRWLFWPCFVHDMCTFTRWLYSFMQIIRFYIGKGYPNNKW